MREFEATRVFVFGLMLGMATPAVSQEMTIGHSIESLLEFAKSRNPEYAAMLAEVDADRKSVV